MRSLIEAIETYKNQLGQRTFWLVDLTLEADGDYAEEEFHLSTQAVEVDAINYQPLLRSKPGVKFPLGSIADAGELKIDNTDFYFGQIAVPRDRVISKSTVKIFFAWKLDNGTIEKDEVFNGQISRAKLSVADKSVGVNIIGDIYNQNIVIGAFPLAQRCVAEFNKNGIRVIGDGLCDWQSNMGGNPEFCDKTKDGADGAEAHWCQKMVAIPFFANVVIQIVQSSSNSSGFELTGRIRQNPEIEPNYPYLMV